MKKHQKGFIVPLVIVIIALLVIGGGFYFSQKKEVKNYENKEVAITYSALQNEVYYNHLLQSDDMRNWSVPGKNVVLHHIDLNVYSCGDKAAAPIVAYKGYNSGNVGGWSYTWIIDCGEYYFVFESADSGQKMYGPFDKNSDPATAPIQTQTKTSELKPEEIQLILKGRSDKIISSIQQLRLAAEFVYDSNNKSYASVCQNGLINVNAQGQGQGGLSLTLLTKEIVDTQLAEITKGIIPSRNIQDQSKAGIMCVSNKEKFAIEVKFIHPYQNRISWCLDSTGKTGDNTKYKLNASTYSCQ